ncbi:Serine phosphatase RsbU, regulator of sigma subunit [Saccharicrinis carchari]|uniref:Serine phosphatase RsbU, regulator of sigma subunit n=1 Tax=Saccharicrinis carchari TaxID=1168039 RepID=A0A521AT55_SACCC|nr:SpoIIE family protein phosphatase [Saccharicrinis carchari]SMO38003.1 Serine phosphatase RsbU, regulator of sigma subunit [Saccharicrinis carchari]
MKQKKTPRFIGLRIYFTATFLYLFLVMPFIGFLLFQNLPEIISESKFSSQLINNQADTTMARLDSLRINIKIGKNGENIVGDELLIEQNVDSIVAVIEEDISRQDNSELRLKKNQNLEKFFRLYFETLILCYLLGMLFNGPFKIYLKRKRKQKKIGKRLEWYCKKFILITPLVNSLILLLPHMVSHIFAISTFLSAETGGRESDNNIFLNFFYVSAIAAFLTTLFVYFWKKNRVQLKYIEYFFNKDQLRKRIFRFRSGKIGRQLWYASIITTFFPLAIVGLYLVLSLTSVRDLGITELSNEQRIILFGNWNDTLSMVSEQNITDNEKDLYYVTAMDTIVMFFGIGSGILVSIIYIFLILRWTTRSIVYPVNELLLNMKKIRKDDSSPYTLVRTNDEVGELAEGFNIMLHKIKNYIANISQMNAELEDKVIERTKEIEEQKEEIEAQKEEITTQLEVVTDQKNIIEAQQYQILDSIRYAKRIQSAILPPDDLFKNSFTDHFILNRPRDIVSGDFYWSIKIESKIYVAVADCTGHGVPGAFLSILGISFLNEIVNMKHSRDASQILGQLRKALIFSLHQQGKEGEARDGLEVALCVLDMDNCTLQFAGANRPLYLVRKCDEKQESNGQSNNNISVFEKDEYQILKYKPDSMPIGIYYDADSPFTNIDIRIQAGDAIYLFTDGYVDQIGGPRRKTFRVKYFRELLFQIQDREMNEQKKILEQNISEWQGGLIQTDDILVIGMKI